jgi:hypothetical protein
MIENSDKNPATSYIKAIMRDGLVHNFYVYGGTDKESEDAIIADVERVVLAVFESLPDDKK